MRHPAPAAALFALTIALTGCGGDDPEPAAEATPSATVTESVTESPTPTETVDPTVLANEQIEKYLEDTFSQDPRRISKARDAAVEGSVAWRYANYRLAVANSNLDGGYPQEPQAVSVGTEEAEVCTTDGNCSTFADFVGDGGAVESFTVNGKDLDKRLVAGDGKALPVAGAGTVEFLGAYRAVTDDTLVVAVKIVAGATPLKTLDAAYRAPSGRQAASSNISGPFDLGANSSATFTMAYPSQQPGGDASLRMYQENGPQFVFTVPVR